MVGQLDAKISMSCDKWTDGQWRVTCQRKCVKPVQHGAKMLGNTSYCIFKSACPTQTHTHSTWPRAYSTCRPLWHLKMFIKINITKTSEHHYTQEITLKFENTIGARPWGHAQITCANISTNFNEIQYGNFHGYHPHHYVTNDYGYPNRTNGTLSG